MSDVLGYEIRGNRSFTVTSAHDEDGPAHTDDEAVAIAENIAYAWGESVTVSRVLSNHRLATVCVVLPDRGF
jgi:hypothetical protein